jgi:hypothetical protein
MARSVPSTTYEIPGALDQALLWDNGPKALNDFLANKPMFRSSSVTTPLVNSGVWTAVGFGDHLIDTDGGHNTSVNISRYVCQVPGQYWVKGCVAWNYSGTGNVSSRFDTALAINGNAMAGTATFQWKQQGFNAATFATGLMRLNVGDYIEVWGRQNTGVQIYFDNGGFGTDCDLNLVWIRS